MTVCLELVSQYLKTLPLREFAAEQFKKSQGAYLAACTMEGGFESSGLRSEERRCPRNSEIFGRPAFEGPWSQKKGTAQWYYETGEWAVSFITHVLVPSCWCFYWASVFWGSPLQLAQLDTRRSEVRKMLADIGKEPLSFARDFLPLANFGVSRTHLSPSTLMSSAKWWREGCPVWWVDGFLFSQNFWRDRSYGKWTQGLWTLQFVATAFQKGLMPQCHNCTGCLTRTPEQR